jgi:beta-glucosidase
MQVEARVRKLLADMTLPEKVGQMCQVTGNTPATHELARRGLLGSVLNAAGQQDHDPARVCNELQAAAVKGSRLGLPLILGRDVIHGFRTVLPIPLGQAASFDMALIEEGAAAAAREASACGVGWTFAPMVDIARDPRWGRIAEGGGEDPLLAARLGAAMVRGFQGDDLSHPERIAACAKHYVGYGAAEGGRDYNTTWIPECLLRDVYLPSFRACVEAGAATLMSAFNVLNGTPASGNAHTIREILKGEWGFDGFVVSDWASIQEMVVHGLCADEKEATRVGVAAGVDMEMVTDCYAKHLQGLVEQGLVPLEAVDEAVARVLGVKLRLGLFDHPYTEEGRSSVLLSAPHLETAKRLATESCVLLKNEGALPLPADVRSLAVIGPLADAPAEQLGCWAFDGRPQDVITPLRALREALGSRGAVRYAPGLPGARSSSTAGFAEARSLAGDCDAVLLFLGEDAGLSGEAHCRAFLGLPGAQEELAAAVSDVGRPVIAVVMTGRPLALTDLLPKVNALLIAWHAGTMGGPAIADLLLGKASPSGRLPASFPRTVGQIPVYYAHLNTGRPPSPEQRELPMGTPEDPKGFVASYLDVAHTALFPFGFGLSYSSFTYSDLTLSSSSVRMGGRLTASVKLTNTGQAEADEVVQLYIRDLLGSLTRPVKELKDFARVRLAAGESRTVAFDLHSDQLAFHNSAGQRIVEPGAFHLMIGPNSQEALVADFTLG